MMNVSFWLRTEGEEEEPSYDFILKMGGGLVGPDDDLHIVLEPHRLNEIVEVLTAMRDDYHERRQAYEEEQKILHRESTTEGGIIVARH